MILAEKNGLRLFNLMADKFKIEVLPLDCSPVLTLINQDHLPCITKTPLIVSGGGYNAAGDPADADILFTIFVGRDPKTTLDEELGLNADRAWTKRLYAELCEALTYCPTPSKTYATGWPFFDPKTMIQRGYAEFNRFHKLNPWSSAAAISFFGVVYTKAKNVPVQQEYLDVIKPYAFVLKFYPQSDTQR